MSWDDQDPFALQAGTITERLSRIALDVTVALGDARGATRDRLERAVTDLDTTIRDMRPPAASRLRLGEGGAGRRQG